MTKDNDTLLEYTSIRTLIPKCSCKRNIFDYELYILIEVISRDFPWIYYDIISWWVRSVVECSKSNFAWGVQWKVNQ